MSTKLFLRTVHLSDAERSILLQAVDRMEKSDKLLIQRDRPINLIGKIFPLYNRIRDKLR